MIESFLMTLQPLEPYFFGNEKTFSFAQKTPADSRYFIKSDRMPSQTTLLGTLRYAMMPVKNASFRYNKQDLVRNGYIIGEESFQMDKEKQSFGAIERLSPVFLMYNGKSYIRTPFDHAVKDKSGNHNTAYTPFREYTPVSTDQEKAWITREYSAKDGLTDSFMELKSGEIIPCKDIFGNCTRVGVNKNQDAKAFFKKQYSMLSPGWMFAAYVHVDISRVESDLEAAFAFDAMKAGSVVYMGQGKSAFMLRLTQQNDMLKTQVSAHLHPNAVYCMSDTLTSASVSKDCLFAAVALHDHRDYSTTFHSENGKLHGRIAKREMLYRLISGGSVFIAEDPRALRDQLADPHVEKVGLNFCVLNKED